MAEKNDRQIKSYSLRKNPVETIKIDGRTYDVQLGNISFTTSVASWQEKLQDIADDKIPHDDLPAAFVELSGDARVIVESVMSPEAADDLLGELNALNFYRIVDVMKILVDVISGEESMAAMRALADVPDTADED